MKRRRVFFGEEDCRLFLRTLGEACGQFRVRTHVWCLMPNHYHLVVETPEPHAISGPGGFSVVSSTPPENLCSREENGGNQETH